MKKLAALLLVAAMTAACFAGCGSKEETKPADNKTSEAGNADSSAEKSEGYTYTIDGTTIAMNAEMAPIAEKLGEPDKYFESESCAFQGLDKVYTYGSVQINTYPKNNVDYVFSIELKDDTVETPEGICIGDSKEKVVKAYGDGEASDGAIVYKDSNCTLTFILNGDSVTNITYTAVTD